MKTSVIEMRDMLAVLTVDDVEKRIGDVPGVESVTVNHAAGIATVRYDETRLHIADIKSDVRHSELESAEPDKATPLTAAQTSAIAPPTAPVPSPVAPASAGSQGTEHKAAVAAAPEPAASRPIPPAAPPVGASAPATARARASRRQGFTRPGTR